jgi:polysaccharide biosynthesis transport protein
MSGAPLMRSLPAPSPSREPSREELHDFAWLVRRYTWWIIAVTLLGISVALLVSFAQTPIYESRTQVLVLPVEEVPATPLTQGPNLATESELVSSVAVAQEVARELGIEGTRELLQDLQVEPVPDTEILEIRYVHTDPVGARDRAAAFAEHYLRYRQDTAAARVDATAEELDRQIRTLRRRFDALQNQIDRLQPDDADAVILRNEAALIQAQLLQRQLERLEVETGSVSAGEIVEPASTPSSPSSPNHVVNGALGLAAGLALGVGSAFARDRLSDRIRSVAEVEDHLATPVLGWIPRIAGWRRKRRARLISLERWRAPATEAYRGLRTKVLTEMSVDGAKSLVVTSARAGDGKSATVANLAVVLARSGKRVTIVSADLRRPRLHDFFGIDGGVGLTDVLNGRTDARAAMQQVTFLSSPRTGPPVLPLWIMPSGRASTDDEELLTTDGFRELIDDLERASDIVLIDVPPVLPVTDALVVAAIADAVLLVIGPRSGTRSMATATRQHLDRAGARVIGVVVNGLSGGGPGFGSRYGYGY